jgi:hypothetical protein
VQLVQLACSSKGEAKGVLVTQDVPVNSERRMHRLVNM